MPDEPTEKPKIIIDEDWKSRVEAEKQAAQQPAAAPAAAGQSAAAAQTVQPQMPPASFSFLVTTLASQAMVALGHLPNPLNGKTAVRLPEARHFIEMLAMLEEKTASHRTPDESAILDQFLHELRLMYVDAQAVQASAAS